MKAKKEAKNAKIFACSLGISTGVQNAVFGLLYLASAEIYYKWPTEKSTQYDRMYIAMFIFIFGAFTAAQSASMGPDI